MLYRNSAVVHREPSGAGGGVRFHTETGRIEMTPHLTISSGMHERIHNLYRRCSPFLQRNLAGESNTYEQLGAVYTNLSSIGDGQFGG